MKEIVDLETIAKRTGYSLTYFRNHWPDLLVGIRPVKFGVGRSIRFFWEDVERLLMQPK